MGLKKLSGFTLLKLIAAFQVVYIHLITHFHLPPVPFMYSAFCPPLMGSRFFSLSAATSFGNPCPPALWASGTMPDAECFESSRNCGWLWSSPLFRS